MRWPLTGNCQLPPAVGGEQRAATDSNMGSVSLGSAADAASGTRLERPPRRVCQHSTGEWAVMMPKRLRSSRRQPQAGLSLLRPAWLAVIVGWAFAAVRFGRR
jgi:hypothetical protein